MNHKAIRVTLCRPEAEAIVFWTKNFRPFLKHVPAVREAGLPFYVQYTINGYPAELEHSVGGWERSVETVRGLAGEFGLRSVVWRYDPIVFSRATPPEFHVENFCRIARALSGATDEVTISFVETYRKTRQNMDRMAAESDNSWWDPPLEEKRDLARRLTDEAGRFRMRLSICTQPEISEGLSSAHCVDTQRLSDVAGRPIAAATLASRPGCGCFASRDIGMYDTCPHGCVYCYAVRSREISLDRFRSHDPESEYLFDDPHGGSELSLEVKSNAEARGRGRE
jgi:hypothetical protein